ncbi:hypothetical protein BH20VER3_BH20VER3_11520 [soil metagenome]
MFGEPNLGNDGALPSSRAASHRMTARVVHTLNRYDNREAAQLLDELGPEAGSEKEAAGHEERAELDETSPLLRFS